MQACERSLAGSVMCCHMTSCVFTAIFLANLAEKFPINLVGTFSAKFGEQIFTTNLAGHDVTATSHMAVRVALWDFLAPLMPTSEFLQQELLNAIASKYRMWPKARSRS